MTPDHAAAPAASAEARKRQLLETALAVFARHGYRKTSMDDVAQAAGVSRQGLYLHFPTKEDLFRAAIEQAMTRSQAEVAAVLARSNGALEERLLDAFDAWVGQFVEAVGSDVDDLVSACKTLLGPTVEQEKERFVARIAGALEAAGLAALYASAGLTAADLATTLCATANGLKVTHITRSGFVAAMRIAIRIVCLPLSAATRPGGRSRVAALPT